MKAIKLISTVIFCCMAGYLGFTAYEKMTMPTIEKFMQVNIEALTQSESGGLTMVICRCHDDARCYGGNSISFRPLCSKTEIGTNGDAAECHQADDVCRNLK